MGLVVRVKEKGFIENSMLQNSGIRIWWHIDEAGQGDDILHSRAHCCRMTQKKKRWGTCIYVLTLDAMKLCHMVAVSILLYLEVWSK